MQGRFTVRLAGPGLAGTTKGALVLAQPDRFRVEIHSPVGPPMMLLASDGRALHAWLSRDNRFYRGDDAARVLAQLSGGAVGLADVNRLLTGGLPLASAEPRELRQDEDGRVRLRLEGPEGSRVQASLDGGSGLVRDLQVYGPTVALAPGLELPVPLMDLQILEVDRRFRQQLPALLKIRLPTLKTEVELEFLSWDELGQIPEVFSLQPPPGAQERDLVESLRRLAEAGEAG